MSKLAEKITEEIIDDLTGRRGLRQAWEQIDKEIQDDIRSEWELIIKDQIEKQGNGGS